MNNEGLKVDLKVEQELLRIENHLTTTFSRLINDGFNEGFKSVKDSITELLGKDIEYIKDTQQRFTEHHKDHFDNNEKRISDISNVKESIDLKVHAIVDDKLKILENQISVLDGVRIKYESKQNTVEKINEDTDRRRNTVIAIIGIIVAALAFLTGFLL